MRPGPRDGRRGSPGPGEDWAPPGGGVGGWDTSRRLLSRRGGRALRFSPGAGPWAPGGRGQNAALEDDPRSPFPVDPPSHLQPQGWRCPPAPGLGVAPGFIFSGFLRCPRGRRCPPPGSWFLAGTSGEHTKTFPTGLSGCRGRGEALFCFERELPHSSATTPRILGTGVSPAGPPPLRAQPQRRVIPTPGRCSQSCPGLRAAPTPRSPVGALLSPFPLPHSRGSAVPRGSAASSLAADRAAGTRSGPGNSRSLFSNFPRLFVPRKGRQEGKAHLNPRVLLTR